MYIRSTRIYTPHACVKGIVEIKDGRIEAILPYDADVKDVLDVGENRIIPGIFDTHNHGTMGYNAGGDDDEIELNVKGYLKGLASQGVTSVFPTTTKLNYIAAFAEAAKKDVDGAKVAGIHSEGPYLNRVGEKGVDTGHPDIDLKHCEDMLKAGGGYLRLVAVAPENPGAKELVEYFTKNGVRIAFAHSNMFYKEAMEAFKWGITVITHTANVMEGIHHRHLGGLGAALLSDDVYNEIICDGLHIQNEMIEIMFRIKNDAFNKFMMVSDCSSMSGAPVGKYHSSWMDVNITPEGFCLSDTGRLCGSTMPVIKGIRNLVENAGIGIHDVLKMACLNPAKVYGFENKGTIEVGKDADLVVIDTDYVPLYTFSEGRCVWDKEKEGDPFNPDFIAKARIA